MIPSFEPDVSFMPKGRPLIIAGPCSAESERQVKETARNIAKVAGVDYLRAGVWKARTRPGDFRGAGEEALFWLDSARAETGLKTCVEVALPGHIEKCLEHRVDMIWIGARTVVNPFSVEEISVALKGVDIPVMVKNPMHPDIDLWIGAMERLHRVGIRKILAVHRGFSTFTSKPFRNRPLWEIPIELKRLFPQLPLIVDPSHITGDRELVPEISQLALDMSFDGLMVEVHPDPENALSDPLQQLSPGSFRKMIEGLGIRKATSPVPHPSLEALRLQMDRIDEAILENLAERLEAARKIGAIKKEQNLSILQLERWRKVLDERLELAEKLGLDAEFIRKLLELIHKESIRVQGKN